MVCGPMVCKKSYRLQELKSQKMKQRGIINGFYKAYPGVAKYLRDISIQGLKNLEVRNGAGRLMKFENPRRR